MTSLFGGGCGAVCLRTMGTFEPSWERATEPFEQDTAGDSCAGLVFPLDCCETEMDDERRFTQEALLEDTRVIPSDSFAPCSLAVRALLTELGGRLCVSVLAILVVAGRLCWRPSCGRAAIGMREVGRTGMGALKGSTVVVVVVAEEVWVAVGIAPCSSSCAGVVLLLFELEESRRGPRPKDRPTADAPTTVAVAQSCVT